jgi:hypothetical protein
MRIIFAVIIILHGLVHLLGWVKGFGLKDVKELSMPISKTMGIMWLIAAVLILMYVVLFLINARYAWLIGGFVAVFSQILIMFFWKDARFGSIPNLLIVLVSFIGYGAFLLRSEFERSVTNDFAANNSLNTDILTSEDIAHLPPIVQKYLYYTRSVGQPKVKNFRAEFTGGMRGKPDEKYMQLHSVQYNFYQKPSRYFFMQATKAGLPASGLHVYQNGKATFQVKLLNWLNVVDAKGEKLDKAETVTLFNDMCCMAPATLIDPNITWETIRDTEVKATFTNGDITVSAVLYFNDTGQLVNFISHDRYETDGKTYKNYPWTTPLENYQLINGYMLPGKAKLIYQKPEGDFTYGELEYKSLAYNLEEMKE